MAEVLRSHIDFIMKLKKQGKTYVQVSQAFIKRFGIPKSSSAVKDTFDRFKSEYDLTDLKPVIEVKDEITRSKVLTQFLKLVEKRKYVPTKLEFLKHVDISKDTIDRKFESFNKLVQDARELDPKVFENIIDESSFSDEAFSVLREQIAEHQRFVITAAVTGCEPHADALSALNTYCKANKAMLLILPCSDPAHQKGKENDWALSHKLPKENIVFKDVAINDNLVLSTIKMSAKQLQPLTGLKRISQKRGSTIVASPKQFLEFSANSNNNLEIPRALASTGAITKANYSTEMYMSERTAYLAEMDHTLGAVIVEVESDQIFHFRHIQFEKKTGTIYDLDRKYLANGKTEKINIKLIQTGDWHVQSTCPIARNATKEMIELMRPEIATFEDFFDGNSINPHERHNVVSLSKKSKQGLLSLATELKACRDELDAICKWPVKNIVMKYGNHEDFLKRWLADGSFIKDPENKILAMKLTIALEEHNAMPFEYAMRELLGLEQPEKIKFLELNDSFKVSGIENGAHGHIGKSGRRNPAMAELEECYGAVNAGHTHSSGIFRQVFRAGTMTKLKLSYNDGASTWTQSNVIQHHNGTRQIIHVINGNWRLKK
jgi:hypothetical protein